MSDANSMTRKTTQSVGDLTDESSSNALDYSVWEALVDRGEGLVDRFDEDGDEKALDDAIECFRGAASMSPADVGDPAYSFETLATTLLARFKLTGNRVDVDEAISHHRTALQMMPSSHPEYSASLNNIANAFVTRFNRFEGKKDLDEAIFNYHRALELEAPDHTDRAISLFNLASALLSHYRLVGDRHSLDSAIANHRDALKLRPVGHPGRPSSANNLANALMARFDLAGDPADLNKATALFRDALELRPPGHPERYSSLNNLANALKTRSDLVGDYEKLGDAIFLHQSALVLTQPSHPKYLGILNDLSGALFARFEGMGNRADLDEAIVHSQRALVLAPPDDPDYANSLNNAANALISRFKQYGDRSDLDSAIFNYRRTLDLTPPGHPERATNLSNLASALLSHFKHTGDRMNLDEAIANHYNALELRPPDHPERSSSLNNLANALMTRFDLVGDPADLDEAIVYFQRALELRPSGHPERSISLNNLANAIGTRFDHHGDRSALNDAIGIHKSALELTPLGHLNRPGNLNNLANALLTRFNAAGDRADLDQSVDMYSRALELTPPGHTDRSMSFINLANALVILFNQWGDYTHIHQAIENSQTALDMMTSGHPLRSASLINLAKALAAHIGDVLDGERPLSSLHNGRDSHATFNPFGPMDRIPDSSALGFRGGGTIFYPEIAANAHHTDPHRTSLTNRVVPCTSCESLGTVQIRDTQSQIVSLLKEATSISTGGSSYDRLSASLMWAHASVKWFDSSSALEAYHISLTLLGVMLADGRSIESRHHRLVSAKFPRIHSLAVDGAACALDTGNTELAVEMLEHGRNVLLTQTAAYRTPVEELSRVNPALAAEFRLLSTKMEASVLDSRLGNVTHVSEGFNAVTIYQHLLRRWTHVTDQIRTLEGFSTFLLPTPFSRLKEASKYGPIIILNLSSMRTDAVIVRPTGRPYLVPLPGATPQWVSELSEKAHHKTGDATFRRCLNEIWQVLVQPIVQVLRRVMELPPGSRIWWCPTSHSSHLPLHAAGEYTTLDKNIPDLYVSSYTTTLSALLLTRQRPVPMPLSHTPAFLTLLRGYQSPTISPLIPTPSYISNLPTGSRKIVGLRRMPHMLIVAQAADLPSVESEVRIISSKLESTVLKGPDATKDSVLHASQSHSLVHFACHGRVNQSSPFRSNISLHDGPLSLLDITRQVLPQADLAFLAACHSASNNRDRPDEVLHLIAGMQFAGFRRVVGAMWAICDLDGPNMAEAFYSSLLGVGGRPVAKSSAHALHRAAQELRMNPSISFSRWTAFVHYGC